MWRIVPGEGVGPVNRTSTKASLLRQLGKDATEADFDAEDGPEHGILIYNNDDSRRLAVVWSQDENRPDMIYICYGNTTSVCKWRTESGIGMGTTFQDLQRRNGEPFLMVKWGSDVGGNLRFERGRLHTELDRENGSLWLTLFGDTTGLSFKDRDAVEGAEDFVRSDNPVLSKLNPKVASMRFIFD